MGNTVAWNREPEKGEAQVIGDKLSSKFNANKPVSVIYYKLGKINIRSPC